MTLPPSIKTTFVAASFAKSSSWVTTIMVTHNLRFAVEYGDRLLMMHQGHAVMDKKGEEKANTKVDDILDMFNAISIECGN